MTDPDCLSAGIAFQCAQGERSGGSAAFAGTEQLGCSSNTVEVPGPPTMNKGAGTLDPAPSARLRPYNLCKCTGSEVRAGSSTMGVGEISMPTTNGDICDDQQHAANESE